MTTPKDFGRMNELGRNLTSEPDLQPEPWPTDHSDHVAVGNYCYECDEEITEAADAA